MKIIIASFSIAKWGGIVPHIAAKARAIKALGHEVDIVQLYPNDISQRAYDKRVAEYENGTYEQKLAQFSEKTGYIKCAATEYWSNPYHGYYLPPSNYINVFADNALAKWRDAVSDADIIMWNFLPTKNKIWEREDGFADWWRFFDLPSSIKQVFTAHDAFFDVRASHISVLRDKISLIECAHVAAYGCCVNIGIPRILLMNPRFIEKSEMPHVPMLDREVDFFAAHIFKPIKHMEDFIRAIPYLNSSSLGTDDDTGAQVWPFQCIVSGVGIEQSYMTAGPKTKPQYLLSRKTDPDLKSELEGRSMWNTAEQHGMSHTGLISNELVQELLQNSKFAVDPSWSAHYAKYCRTHINGFIIEAMLNGCYPVIRDYRGLAKEQPDDPIFDEMCAIVIPHDATPVEFAFALHRATNMSEQQYFRDTQHNFRLANDIFNVENNMCMLFDELENDCRLSKMYVGEDSDNVKRVTADTLAWFGTTNIKWET